MASNDQNEERVSVEASDVMRVDGKFPCLMCDQVNRLRWKTLDHMVKDHNVLFKVSARTTYRNKKRRLEEEQQNYQLINQPNSTNHSRQIPAAQGRRSPSPDIDNEPINIHAPEPDVIQPINNDQEQDWDITLFNPIQSHAVPLYRTESESGLTQEEHLVSVTRFSERFKLSAEGTSKLIDLLQLHMPKSSHLDSNTKHLRASAGFKEENLVKTYYCKKCDNSWNTDTDSCSNQRCTNQQADYFTSCDMRDQLKLILTRPGMWKLIMKQKNRPPSDVLTDIIDGEMYQMLKLPGAFLSGNENVNLTLTVFSDGVALYKSSKVGVWLLFCVINEIPLKYRFEMKNMLLWGIHQSKHKPNSQLYYGKFVETAQDLYERGVAIEINGTETIIKIMPLVFTQDLAGRALMMCMKSHGAKFACVFCEIRGRRRKRGKATARSYHYLELDVQERTVESARLAAETGHTVPKKGVKGFLDKSPLWDLPHFTHFMIGLDYMHQVLLGITPTLNKSWWEITEDRAYIGRHKAEFIRRLMSVKPCKQISRLPRENYKQWKASEDRSFLLLYSLHLTEDLLPDRHHRHLGLLVEGIFLLLQDKITEDDIERSRECLKLFLECYDSLYGPPGKPNPYTLNIHGLVHLPDCVKRYGGLYTTSAMPFESLNGQIIALCTGRQSVKTQLFWSTHANKICANMEQTSEGDLAKFLDSTSSHHYSEKKNEMSNCVVLGPMKQISIAESELIIQTLGDHETQKYLHAEKIVIGGIYYDSKSCTRIKKRISYFAELDCDTRYYNVAEIDSYLINTESEKVYMKVTIYRYGAQLINGIAPHCLRLELESDDRLKILPVEKIYRPLLYIERNGIKYISKLPNLIERD